MSMTFKEMADWLKNGDVDPEWFTAGKNTPKKQILNTRRGLHPFGAPLTDVEGATCGNCVHRTQNRMANTYQKCALMKNTGGPGTDLKLKWRGCVKWEEVKP